MSWKFFLRYQLGFSEAQAIEVTPEDLPGEAEQVRRQPRSPGNDAQAGLQLAESDVRGKNFD